MNHGKILTAALVLAIGMALSAGIISRLFLKIRHEQSIAVKGYAEADVVSDFSRFCCRYSARGGSLPEAYAGLAALGALLDKLDRLMSSEQGDTPDARQAIAQVQQGVQRAADQAAGKIHDLESAVVKTAGGLDAPDASWRRLSAEQQARTLELVAEIVQELAQPLSAMNCAVDMTLQERIGPLAAAQKNILALAADSGGKIADLFERLRKVTGLPRSLSPDKESVYGIQLD